MELKRRLAGAGGDLFVYGSLTCLFIVTFFPFWNILVLSLNDAGDSLRGGLMLWPRSFTLDSYRAVLTNSEIFAAGRLTLVRTLTGVPLTVINTALLSYGLSKRTLPGRRFITLFFIFTMYFNGGLIPNYMIVKALGLIDNFWVFILPKMVDIFWMLLVRTFMEDLPEELEESAKLDGANDIKIFFRITLPLCVPVLATITLFSTIWHWNAWYDSYVYTYKPELTTLSSALVRILNQYQTGDMLSAAAQAASQSKRMPVSSETIRMTVTIISALPIFIIYPLLQKYLIKGMLVGAIKG